MTVNRRQFLKKAAFYSALPFAGSNLLLAKPAFAQWNAENFAPEILQETLKRLFKDSKIIETDKIDIDLPKIAEKGAAVPITVTSSLQGVKNIAILVEQNAVPLAARFDLEPELAAYVSARLKIEKTSYVFAVVETDSHVYASSKKTVNLALASC